MEISKNWLKMSEIYKRFSKDKRIRWLDGGGYETYDYIPSNLDFSDKAKEEAYLFESRGIGVKDDSIFNQENINGFLYGKRMMDITVKMWKEDIPQGLLFLSELYSDFPHWWLDKIFNRKKVVV